MQLMAETNKYDLSAIPLELLGMLFANIDSVSKGMVTFDRCPCTYVAIV